MSFEVKLKLKRRYMKGLKTPSFLYSFSKTTTDTEVSAFLQKSFPFLDSRIFQLISTVFLYLHSS